MWNKPTEEELAKLPPYRSTESIPLEDKLIHMHFFIGACDWYIAEYDPEYRVFFGFANLGDPQNAEWGDIPLDELTEINIRGVEIDRDLYWKPKKFDEIPIAGLTKETAPILIHLRSVCFFCDRPPVFSGETTGGLSVWMCKGCLQVHGTVQTQEDYQKKERPEESDSSDLR